MRYISSLRKSISSKAFRAAIALVDQSLALAAVATDYPELKVILTCLQVLTKFFLWIAALHDTKQENAEDTERGDEPP